MCDLSVDVVEEDIVKVLGSGRVPDQTKTSPVEKQVRAARGDVYSIL